MAYFDNAATTYPKPDVVYSFMSDFYKRNGASAGRGNYKSALSAGVLISETRSVALPCKTGHIHSDCNNCTEYHPSRIDQIRCQKRVYQPV